jgi:hypothetical protein
LRKPRKTVYVHPGKDVTLYVPSDTPQEVCDYLNSLKEQGMFSSGVIEIITNYVQSSSGEMAQSSNGLIGALAVPDSAGDNQIHNGAPASVTNPADNEEVSPPPHEVQPAVKRRLSLSEIFSQAKKNSLDKH